MTKPEDSLPRWVDRPEYNGLKSHIEYKNTRILIYEEKEGTWCVTVHPLFKDVLLPGHTLQEAKYSAIIETRQRIAKLLIEIQMLLEGAERGI